MLIKTPDVNNRGVSDRIDLQDKLINVEQNRSPVKMKNFKSKINSIQRQFKNRHLNK